MLKKLTQKRNKKGFTLVELIVVIAILGILAAIAVPRLSGFTKTAGLAADKATAASIGKAAELYSASNNTEAGKNKDGETLTIDNLVDADLLAEDPISQSKEGTKFILVPNGKGLYKVKLGTDGDVLYPDPKNTK